MSGVDDLDIQCSRVEGDTSDGIWISSGGLNFIAGEVYGGDVAIRSVNGAELDLNASVVDGKNSAVDSDGDTTILDCEIDTNADGGSALILRNSAESAYVERSRLRLDNDTTANNVVTLYGVGWNTAPRPPAFHASILKSVSANPHYAIGLSGGATTANVFMMNCGLSSGLAPGISKLAPDSTDTYGNYVIPAAAR